MARIFNPQNHLGKVLVPAGQTKPTSVTDKIDISWLDVADVYDSDATSTSRKVATTAALVDAISKVDSKLAAQARLHFEILNSADGLETNITKDTYSKLATTIFLIPQTQPTGTTETDDTKNDNYVEYICANIGKYDEEKDKQPTTDVTVKAKYEVLGYINNVVVPATDSTLGSVQTLSDIGEIDEEETNPVVPTAEAVKDYVDTEIASAISSAKNEIESTIDDKIEEALGEDLKENETIKDIQDQIDGLDGRVEKAEADIEDAKSDIIEVTEYAAEIYGNVNDLRETLSSTTINVTKETVHAIDSDNVTITQAIITGEQFSAAYLDLNDGKGYALCMPEVAVGSTSLTIQMFEEEDEIPIGTKIKVVTILPTSIGDFTIVTDDEEEEDEDEEDGDQVENG